MIKNYVTYLKARFSSKKGQGMVEYGLIVGLIAVGVIVMITTMGTELQRLFTSVSTALTNAGK